MNVRDMDASDGMVTLGLLLVAAAIWGWWGLAAVLAYAGTVLVIVGLAMAVRGGRK